MWVVMPDLPVPLLLPSDGVHFMNEMVAVINFLDQARNIFVVDERGESTHKPPPSCQLPLAVMRLLPPLIVVSALHGGCNTTGSLPSTGSSEPGAEKTADAASILLLAADPATPLLVTLASPSKPLIVLLNHAERGVGRCVDVSLSTHPRRGSTEKEPEEPERTDNKERTRAEKPVHFGPYPLYAVPFGRDPVSAVPFGRYSLSAVPSEWYPGLAEPFGRYRELSALFWRY